MREQTRVYTSALPRINLQFLADMQRKLVDSSPKTQIFCDTESGRVYFSLVSGGYSATINGVTRVIGITITRAGFGYRRWYICPHCGGRVAKLFIGQSEDEVARLRRSVWKQRHDLWGDDYPPAGSLLNSPLKFPKPAGMRWDTFEKKRSRLLKTESAYWRLKEPRDAKGFARVMRKAEASIRSFERASKKATP